MFGVAITYLILGSPYILKEKLQLNLNNVSLKIYKTIFKSGLVILLFAILNFFVPSHWWYIPLVLSVIFTSLYAIKTVQNWLIAMEVMKKLDDET